MNKKFFSLVLSLCCTISMFGTMSVKVSASTNKKEARIVLDCKDEESLPPNFRTSSTKISPKSGTMPDLTGLSQLNISGSGQFTEKSLPIMINQLPSNKPIIVLDFRQESHLLIDGHAISWYVKGNGVNKGKSLDYVIKDEEIKIKQLLNMSSVELTTHSGKPAKVPVINNPKSVITEETLVKSNEIDYCRIPVTDGHAPTAADADTFIKLVKNLPENAWIHFHCLAGKGRTTTFMCMYDMMHNAKNVSFEDIIQRQYLLGGYDVTAGSSDASRERAEFIRGFYNYCKSNTDNFQTLWSEWINNNFANKAS